MVVVLQRAVLLLGTALSCSVALLFWTLRFFPFSFGNLLTFCRAEMWQPLLLLQGMPSLPSSPALLPTDTSILWVALEWWPAQPAPSTRLLVWGSGPGRLLLHLVPTSDRVSCSCIWSRPG